MNYDNHIQWIHLQNDAEYRKQSAEEYIKYDFYMKLQNAKQDYMKYVRKSMEMIDTKLT